MGRLLIVLGLLGLLPHAVAQSDTERRMEQVAGVAPQRVQELLQNLQAAVRNEDRAAVSRMIDYPLQVRTGSRRIRLVRASDFLARYDAILTGRVKQAVARQQFNDLFVNSKGVMIGNGEVWVGGVCKDRACKEVQLRIIAVNP